MSPMRYRGLAIWLTLVAGIPAQTEKAREPGHLQPLAWAGGESADYHRRVDELLGFDDGDVTMLTRPSFSSESLVRLEVENWREVRDYRAEPLYAVHHAITNANVWSAARGWWSDEATEPASFRQHQAAFERLMDEWDKSGRKPPMPQPVNGPSLLEHIRVAKRSVPFPAPLAQRIGVVWRRMLLGVRYPERDRAGFDGTTYVFAAEYRVGKVWSPDEGTTPALMIEVGESLAAYALGKDDERGAALRVVEARVLALEQRLDEQAKAPPGDKGK